MSDYLEGTNDDIIEEDDEILDEEPEVEEEEETDSENAEDEEVAVTFSEQKSMITRENVYDQVYNQKYRTIDRMTKYEKARIIGVRAAMIADGMGSMVDPGDLTNPIDIAKKELSENKIPFILRRPIPSRNHKKPNYEYRKVSDLQKNI
jgi:DNA-directed RNA polymerase I, II, and III subunit RPABC2